MTSLPPSATTRAGCEKVIALIADYLNGDLDPDLTARFERHLSQCQECLAYINTYQQTLHLVRQLPDEGMPQNVQTRVWELISRHEPLATVCHELSEDREKRLIKKG